MQIASLSGDIERVLQFAHGWKILLFLTARLNNFRLGRLKISKVAIKASYSFKS